MGWDFKTILSYLKSAPSNLSNCKIWRKQKCLNLGNKNALFGSFWARILKKTIVMFEISTFEVVQNFVTKQNCQKLGLKMPYLGIFDQKDLIWVYLGKSFKKTIFIFETSTLKFVYLQNFTKKQKCLNLGPKVLYLGIFGLEFKKKLLSYLKPTPSNLSNCNNFVKKQKCLNLGPKMPYLRIKSGTKNALFENF